MDRRGAPGTVAAGEEAELPSVSYLLGYPTRDLTVDFQVAGGSAHAFLLVKAALLRMFNKHGTAILSGSLSQGICQEGAPASCGSVGGHA
jgi:hypothetical protein